MWDSRFRRDEVPTLNSYAAIEKTVGRSAALVVAGLVILGVIVWRVRKHRSKQRAG